MAATRRKRRRARKRQSLGVLAAAALALPGLAPSVRAAEDDDFSFQYGRYQEGDRNLYGVHSDYDPLHVDSLRANWRVTLLDRLKFTLNFAQDTWSGATPITTAPRAFDGNRPTSPDGVSGATPFIDGDLYLDANLTPLDVNAFGEVIGPDSRLVDTLSSASPETRDQIGFELGWEWDEASLRFGAGVSDEDDYESRFTSLGGTLAFDQNLTTLSLDLSYSASDIAALLDHDALPYIDTSAYRSDIDVTGSGDRELTENRDDFGARLGLSRILGKNSLVEASVGWLRSSGYLANPYKVMEVAFIDPEQQFLAPPGGYYAQVRALLEERPGRRDQWTADLRFVQYVAPFDASLHLGYRFFHDDWGVDAHTLEASWDQPLPGGWLVTPRVRYYSQSRADFYQPYLVSKQAFVTVVSDPDTGDILSITPFDPNRLPSSFSSDGRLAAFGALSGGVTLSKQIGRGITFAADFEYYSHQGRLKLGGGGEDAFGDFDAYTLGATLTLDATALSSFGYQSQRDPGAHRHHSGSHAPAGVMLAHMVGDAGGVMFGLRYAAMRQGNDMLHGARQASDAQVAANACEGNPCRTAPEQMDMNMVMLDLTYAPTDWLNLMLMPQFVDMRMDLRTLAGAEPDVHGSHGHSTGGVGDTGIHALVKLFDDETNHLHAGLGVSVPTGQVDLEFRRSHQEDRGAVHYGMQLGSGTWDLLPSITWTGNLEPWSWGAQVGGVRRLERENDSGYALGDVLQVTAWTGYALTDWLAVTARGVYTAQGAIRGEYDDLHDDSGPMDFPGNYGGQYWDVGLGLELVPPGGFLAGNSLSAEWLQPLRDDVKGYQLERRGSLFVSWNVEF